MAAVPSSLAPPKGTIAFLIASSRLLSETKHMSAEHELPRLLTVEQLASLFVCSTEKIKRMLRRGELPGFKFGKCWFVRSEDLERELKSEVHSERHLRRSA